MNGLFLPLAAWAVSLAPLTLTEAVDRAIAHDPGLADLSAQKSGAEAGVASSRANYFPKLRLEGNVIVWDEAQTLSIGPPGAAPPLTVRDQVTAQATVQVVQPLAGLYPVSLAVELGALGVDVTGVQADSARRRLEMNIVEAWFRALQAQALEKAAARQVESLESQEKKVVSLANNGVLAKNEVLRLQVALSAARQRLLEVQGQVALAQASLSVLTGGAAGEHFELDETPPAFAEEPAPTIDVARETGLRERRELVEVQTRMKQAEQGVKLARAKLLPDLNLIGQYQHTEGNSFAEANALFAGLFLSWTAWEWGATARQVDVAESQTFRARAMLEQLQNGVKLDVESAHVGFSTADAGISVAQGGVSQAEEALRLERARFDSQQSTTTDIVGAEAALMQARVNLETARFQRLVARARLRFAMGLPVIVRSGEKI